MSILKTFLRGTAVAALALAAMPAMAETIFVTNANDTGPGSLRKALEDASSNSLIDAIVFQKKNRKVVIGSPLTYTGNQFLYIDGRGARITPSSTAAFNLLESTGGGDLTLEDLTFQEGLTGILVEVPGDAEGQISVSLFNVTVVDNLLFGLSVDEDDPGVEPFAASVRLVVMSSYFARNGLLETDDEDEGDVDAVRVNERGDGDITAIVLNSHFIDNSADGFELDEEGPGDATLTALDSIFDDNGVTRPGGDDGLDIDESDEGSIWLNVFGSTFNRNTDDGIGLDETGPGDMHLSLVQIEASGNTDSGVSADEGDAGNYHVEFIDVTADQNLDKGADMTEADDGDFDGLATTSSFSSNDDDGIAVEQLGDGAGVLRLIHVEIEGNGNQPVDATGVALIQVP